MLVMAMVVAAMGFFAVLGARMYLNNAGVPVVTTLVAPGAAPRAMAVVSHPGDEVAIGGTLATMADQGTDVTLVVLTRGEKSKARPAGMTDEQLAVQRAKELQASAAALGVSNVVQLGFPDAGLVKQPLADLSAAVAGAIAQYQPSTVITTDAVVGLYGNADHRVTSTAVEQAVVNGAAADPNYPVGQLWVTTLSPRVAEIVADNSQGFAKALAESGTTLPEPTVAVDISTTTAAKAQAADDLITQRSDLDHVAPGLDLIPQWAYARLFGLEYFHLQWER